MKNKDKKPDVHHSVETTHPCVLIYDDDREILFLCNTILAKSQYHVKTLLRCDHVIKDITRIKPDIILMDLWIPESGGEKAIAIIKANKATQHVPIIIFSANEEIKEICENTNAEGYIQKPFDVVNFKETIERILLQRTVMFLSGVIISSFTML